MKIEDERDILGRKFVTWWVVVDTMSPDLELETILVEEILCCGSGVWKVFEEDVETTGDMEMMELRLRSWTKFWNKLDWVWTEGERIMVVTEGNDEIETEVVLSWLSNLESSSSSSLSILNELSISLMPFWVAYLFSSSLKWTSASGLIEDESVFTLKFEGNDDVSVMGVTFETNRTGWSWWGLNNDRDVKEEFDILEWIFCSFE